MKIDPEILKYTEGRKFSNSLEFKFEKTKYKAEAREDIIIQIIKNLDIIHIGCSDHVLLIREKIKINKWLHKLLTEHANICLGIDNDKESIDFLINELGYNNVRHGDILTDTFPEFLSKKWDYAVFGEIIEHLDNPVDFLISFRKKFGSNTGKFLITVPNIYNMEILKNMFDYREIVNSDHRFWFTPYTILKVLSSSGLIPENIYFSNLQKLSIFSLISRKLKQLLHITPVFPFYYFKSLVITGTIS
jgi:hypothetical protein